MVIYIMAGVRFFIYADEIGSTQLPYLDTFVFADPYCLNESIVDTPCCSDFRKNVMARDGEFCIVIGVAECQAAHLVPKFKGDEVTFTSSFIVFR